VAEVVAAIDEMRGLPTGEVAETLSENARRCFGPAL
jgi:Tat protein secretion system quality control protein TatD with DNase activity